MHIHILSQLLKNIKRNKLQGEKEGDLYGLKDGSENIYILACRVHHHQLPHDPLLMLPSSFIRLGSFLITKEKKAHTHGKDLLLVYSDDVQVFTSDGKSGVFSPQAFKTIEEKDLYKIFMVATVSYKRAVTCRSNSSDVETFIRKLKEEVSSPESYFKLENSNILLNINPQNCECSSGKKNIGRLVKFPSKKSTMPMCSFELYANRSRMELSSTAPVVQIDSSKNMVLWSGIDAEVVLYLPKSLALLNVAEYLVSAITNQLQLAEFWLLKQLEDRTILSSLKSYVMNHYLVGHIMVPLYPLKVDEKTLEKYRQQTQEALLLPSDKPVMRKANIAYLSGERPSQVIVNPHESVSKSGVQDGNTSVVKGFYGYHHYMQDNFNDNKWGCAYRSLQTLISWFRLQGYTEKPIPTHREIQQILVDMKDKPASFIGSQNWIGSTEVGFVLESLLNVRSKFISVNSGDDLPNHGRELCMHFQITGTPIMIGGGVYAHTIIGVDWSPVTGDIKYLILDPHYTGMDNLAQIIKQGWCGWKDSSFWNAKAYYNLCLPQLPDII